MNFQNNKKKYSVFTSVVTCIVLLYLINFSSYVQHKNKTKVSLIFTIHILTYNRPKSFLRLMTSLASTHFYNDTVDLVIHIDGGWNNNDTDFQAENYNWSHGKKSIIKFPKTKGLAQAWFSAWLPKNTFEYAIIFEDDIVVSPFWYKWLKGAWLNYGDREDIAGISLQRQTLIPRVPGKQKEIINNHEPFLFALVGSIGFAPHPVQWKKFISWVNGINFDKYDVSIPDLITTKWYFSNKKGHMWTQHFIYFCRKNKLYTLYVNLPDKRTLAQHWKEKGVHFSKTVGPDFKLAEEVLFMFPKSLNKYNFAGNLVN